jgi:hypothetical protein
MPQDSSINGRPIQWGDVSPRGRKIVSDNIRSVGENLPKIAHEAAEKFQGQFERTGNAKARVQAASARAVAPELKSKPVSLQSAANSRQRLYNRGIEDRAAANPGDPHQVIPTGAGWYFEHHGAIAKSAEQHGFPKDAAIAASGVMSPQNSPENERAAVHAMMDAYANHKVTVTPEVHQHLAKQGIDVTQHLGQSVHFDQLPRGAIGHLSATSIRDKVPTSANLKDISRGGTRQNITRAEDVLLGETHPDDAVDPHSAPKVWSYVHNTRQAVPNSSTHVEFMGRVHQDAMVRRGHISADQQALPLYPEHENVPDNHLLSPKSHTVEDTWQNSATFDQPKTMAQGRTSVYKAAGSLPQTYPVAGVKTRVNEETGKRETAHPDARVSSTSLTHAYNNRATQKAAEQQSRGSGTTVPPVAVQEVGWVQMRKDAGKDPAFNLERRSPASASPLGEHVTGQLALFGEHLPGGERVRGADATPSRSRNFESGWAPPDMSRREVATEEAKASAIYLNKLRAGRAARGV